ncbi:hypothetical protein [Dyella sp. Tek66A03]|uniref:hypothetical protein n=1 Tax=Dyella sp. Tek66A03 TaxID=3458298 RepID=UPI00403EEE80
MWVTVTTLLLLFGVTQSKAFASEDACGQLLPKTLKSAIAARFPDYRPPRENDNLAEDVRYARTHARIGCLGVVTGGFYGDSKTQWVIALRSVSVADSALVVVARKAHSGWLFEQLISWPTLASRLYVSREQPGHYERGEREPASVGEPEQLDCRFDAVGIGETESGQLNYCRIGGKWRSITVSE